MGHALAPPLAADGISTSVFVVVVVALIVCAIAAVLLLWPVSRHFVRWAFVMTWLGLNKRSTRIRWTQLVLGTLAAAVVILNAAIPDSRWKWIHEPVLLAVLAGTALLLDALERSWRLLRKKTVEQESLDKAERVKLLRNLLSEISEAVPYPLLGVSFWVVRERVQATGSLWYLKRLDRERHPLNVPIAEVVFTIGVGVNGESWRDNLPKRESFRKFNKSHPQTQLTDTQFIKLPANTTRGMNCHQFNQLHGKYDEVVAVPVRDDTGKFLGCLSLDLKRGAPDTATILTDAVYTKVEATADTLRPLFTPRYSPEQR